MLQRASGKFVLVYSWNKREKSLVATTADFCVCDHARLRQTETLKDKKNWDLLCAVACTAGRSLGLEACTLCVCVCVCVCVWCARAPDPGLRWWKTVRNLYALTPLVKHF
jgi:hypothetical protein